MSLLHNRLCHYRLERWSIIQNWYDDHDGRGREIPRQPRVEDCDEDYQQFLNERPKEEKDDEDEHLSSIQENEPVLNQPGYAPRAPTYDNDTREWYRFFHDISMSAREVQCPSTSRSNMGPSLQSTANSKSAKAKGKGNARK
nr:hypothetical protein Itr_chr12CG17450 [Ipomoea trifida]